MIHAIRQDVVVLPGGRIEIISSELTPGAHAQVIVLEEATKAEKRSAKTAHQTGRRAAALPKETRRVPGKPTELRSIDRRAFMRLPLRERRRILAAQTERAAGQYRQGADIRNLGGGDFLDC